MTHADKNPNIGIYLYLQTYVELSTYRVNEICKILLSASESLSRGNTLAIPNSSISSVLSMVRVLYARMRTVSSSLTFLTNSLQRLLKKSGYLLPLCLMRQNLIKINVLISRYVETLDELRTTFPNIVANLPLSKTHTLSWALLLNVLDSSVKELANDMSLVYRNVLSLYTKATDSVIMNAFPKMELHTTAIRRSLFPSFPNYDYLLNL